MAYRSEFIVLYHSLRGIWSSNDQEGFKSLCNDASEIVMFIEMYSLNSLIMLVGEGRRRGEGQKDVITTGLIFNFGCWMDTTMGTSTVQVWRGCMIWSNENW